MLLLTDLSYGSSLLREPTESLPGVITKIHWDGVVDCDIMQPDNT